ncbi:MAG: hypothetical protein ACI4SC_03475 [Candidatus Neoclostridium sp.]
MQNKDRKDEKLDRLFTEYVEQNEKPSENVMLKAKEYMKKSPERVAATSPVRVAAAGAGGERAQNPKKNVQFIVLLTGIIAVAIVVLALMQLINSTAPSPASVNGTISRAQLTEISKLYEQKDFLPFVEAETVTEYKEYALTQRVENHEEGDVVVYYVEYARSDAVAARLNVKVSDIAFDELSYYETLTDYYEAGGIVFGVSAEKVSGNTYVYFSKGDYVYCLTVETDGQTQIETILDHIAECF